MLMAAFLHAAESPQVTSAGALPTGGTGRLTAAPAGRQPRRARQVQFTIYLRLCPAADTRAPRRSLIGTSPATGTSGQTGREAPARAGSQQAVDDLSQVRRRVRGIDRRAQPRAKPR